MVATHLFSAVKYMNKNGVYHGNLRPEIIMFESENGMSDIKLIDFILARKSNYEDNTNYVNENNEEDLILI